MDTAFRLPELGDGIGEGTIVGITVATGDEVTRDQVLFEVETDKVVMEIPADRNGRIGKINIEKGAVVAPGDQLLEFDATDTADTDTSPEPSLPAQQTDNHRPNRPGIDINGRAVGEIAGNRATQVVFDQITAESAATAAAEMTAASPLRADVLPFRTPLTIIPAGPSVRRLARELGVELEQIKGSGPQGRISKDDVKEFARHHLQHSQPDAAVTVNTALPVTQRSADSVTALPDFAEFGSTHREVLSGIQQATRNNMDRAWCEIPHAWLQHQADISELEQQRQRYKTMAKAEGVALSLTPFIVKALALALKEFPLFNTSLDEAANAIVYRDYIDVGVAVDTPRGLLVASVRHADDKTIYQLARDIDNLAGRAREGKLTVKDMQGAGITLSNLGNMGVTSIYPIINWPQVAIVGIAAGQWQQCRRGNGEWHEQLMLPLTLAFDHRIINGADAARFLGFIKSLLEEPFRFCLY